MAESKKMMKREIAFMKSKKAPKDMLKHEIAEHAKEGMKQKYAKGGKVSDFDSAFRSARSAGDDEFEWNGKKYTTEMKGESKPAYKPHAPSAMTKATYAGTNKPSTPAPAARKTFRQVNAEMGAASDARREARNAANDQKAAARGRALKGAMDFVTKGDGKKRPSFKERFSDAMAKGGPVKKYAKGGSVSSRADGIARKGKTNTKQVKMARGGSTKGC